MVARLVKPRQHSRIPSLVAMWYKGYKGHLGTRLEPEQLTLAGTYNPNKKRPIVYRLSLGP